MNLSLFQSFPNLPEIQSDLEKPNGTDPGLQGETTDR